MNTPFRPLHPTLKKCKCGFVGTRAKLYKHLDHARACFDPESKNFLRFHGEVPLNTDDPVLLNYSNIPFDPADPPRTRGVWNHPDDVLT